MGACVSFHHKASAMKVHKSFGSNNKTDNHLAIPPSPIKEKPPIINGDVPVKPQLPPLHSTAISRDFGSKEEKFLDAQAWLESDCDDDFMSVNGEFTPSRGNTPVHHNFSTGPPQVNGGAATVDHNKPPSIAPSESSPSPTKKKVRLSDLFKESLRANHDDLDEEKTELASESEEVETPTVSVHSGGVKPKRGKWAVPVPGCFPRVLSGCRLVTTHEMEAIRK